MRVNHTLNIYGRCHTDRTPELDTTDLTIFRLFDKLDGAMINVNDAKTVFTDAAGTTQAAVGDYVRLVKDQSGRGNDLVVVPDSSYDRRPKLALNAATGLRYLDFTAHKTSGASWGTRRYMQITSGLEYGTLSVFIKASLASSTLLLGHPQVDGSSTSPYLRWGFYGTSTSALTTRLNGTEYSWNATGVTTAIGIEATFGLITDTGKLYVNGSVNKIVTGATITYPNAAPVYINRNGEGTEAGDISASAVFILNRSLTSDEIALVNTWMSHALVE